MFLLVSISVRSRGPEGGATRGGRIDVTDRRRSDFTGMNDNLDRTRCIPHRILHENVNDVTENRKATRALQKAFKLYMI